MNKHRNTLDDDPILGPIRKYIREAYLPSLLTCREVAVQRGVTTSTVYAWRRAGRIQALRLGGRWFVEPAELERLVTESHTKSESR